ncbi:hypothetical protein [Rubritalea tangerina]|uniref:Uncharacterized protein n=1 Tax=Rubritalea tangerina TaxID=430798 RepID=A0ABW4ZE94_9BACT
MFKKTLTLTLAATLSLPLASCVTKQTTRKGDVVVDEKYVVKRPVKKFFETVEVE